MKVGAGQSSGFIDFTDAPSEHELLLNLSTTTDTLILNLPTVFNQGEQRNIGAAIGYIKIEILPQKLN